MTELFDISDITIDQTAAVVLKSNRPEINSLVDRYAEVFSIAEGVTESASFVSIRDGNAVLEIYPASGSLWWSADVERELEDQVSFPDSQAAETLAQEFIEGHQLTVDARSESSIGYTEVIQEGDTHADDELYTTRMHVNYRFNFEGLPVAGPGAKMQVTFGDASEVVECYRFWRELAVESEHPVLPVEIAVDLLKGTWAFADLDGTDSSVRVESCRLAFFALPPQEAQEALLPVYEFRGQATTPTLESYEFTHRVVAIEVPPDLLRRAGALVQEMPMIRI